MGKNRKKNSKKPSVVTHVKDEYKFTHIRTTKSTYTDANNRSHNVIKKEVSTATKSKSFSWRPQQAQLTAGAGSSNVHKAISASPRGKSTVTQTSKTTFRGPNNQTYTFHNRNYHSSIQKQRYNPPTADSSNPS